MIKKLNTVLVSGANGFLGKELVNQLLEEAKYEVVAITSKPNDLMNEVGSPNLKAYSTDVWESKVDFNHEEVIFINCAFPRTGEPSSLAEGLVFTENIIRKCVDLGVQNIINISSQSVYSQKEKATINERGMVSPESLYGMAKYSSERIVHSICARESYINYTNIRLASLTGLEFDVRMTNRFVKKALNKEMITIIGGNQLISYLDVRDAASAIQSMFDISSAQWNPFYNLGNNESISLNNLVQLIEEIGKEYSIDDMKVEYKNNESNFSNLINSDLFYNQFKWSPTYQYKDMVEELFNFYSKKT